MKSAEYLFRPLRRKIALYKGYHKYQEAQKHHDLYRIIDEELQAAAKLAFGVETTSVQQRTDKPVQPFHAEYLVLYEVPHVYSSPLSISVRISAAVLTISGHSVLNRPFDRA